MAYDNLSTVNDFDIDLIQKNTTISLAENLIPCFDILKHEQCYNDCLQDTVTLTCVKITCLCLNTGPIALFLAQNELKIAE